MRKILTAAAALAPLCLAASPHGVRAATISSSTSAPIATATANAGAADDITITSAGSVSPTAPGPAVTLNSSNGVSNAGSISFSNIDDATGILVTGTNTGAVANTGTISVTESYAASDSNRDGATEEPFAKGAGRYGIHFLAGGALGASPGGTPYAGSVVNTGTITVKGNASYGILLESPIAGSFTSSGAISLTGDNGVAVQTAGVGGLLQITGAVTVQGKASEALVIDGPVTGATSLYSAITATGYGATTRSTVTSLQTTIQGTMTEVQQGGTAVAIAGSALGGVFLGAAPTTTSQFLNTTKPADQDADGIDDSIEGSSAISVFGANPAVVIGAGGQAIVLDAFGAGANAFGLINRGTITASGLIDGAIATAVQIGAGAGGSVLFGGGLRNVGSITATSYGANALGVHVESGTTMPTLQNEGAISSSVLQPLTVSTTAPFASNAILIDAGANVSTLNNFAGTIAAAAIGDGASASAVVDGSATGLTTINNQGVISAVIKPNTAGDLVTGKAVAIDLSASTVGVTLTQSQAAAYTTRIASAAVATTTTPAAPSILGDIRLGNGVNTVNLQAGTITGALSLGAGAGGAFTVGVANTSTTSVSNASVAAYAGALTFGGTGLALNVVNGSLTTTSPTVLNLSTLTVGAAGALNVAVDPAGVTNSGVPISTQFIATGAATVANGAKIGITLQSAITTPQSFTIIRAGALNFAASAPLALGQLPYLYTGDLTVNAAANTVVLDLREKTASEIGFTRGEAAALPAITQAIAGDRPVAQALLGQYTAPGFFGAYDSLLPDYAGGVFQTAEAATRAISRAAAEPNEVENATGSRGAWVQEIAVGASQDRGESGAFTGGGFGFVGGVEAGGFGLGAFGATAAFLSADIRDPHLPGDAQTSISMGEAGLYYQGEFRGLMTDARVGLGYVEYAIRRQLIQLTSTGTIALNRQAKSNTDGYTATGRIGVAYQFDFGRYFIRPQVHGDYFRMDEGAYTERAAAGGGSAFALAVSGRTGDEASGSATVAFGARIGTGLILRPQVELGVRDVFTGGAGDTVARFASGGPSFTLKPGDISGAAGTARFKLKASTQYFEIGVDAGGEARTGYYEGDAKVQVRVLF